MQTPLAWKNLTSSRGKCLLASTGVGFAVVLMFMQIGFQRALIDNNVRIMNLFNAEVAQLTMVGKARYNVSTEERFPRRLVNQALSYPGIIDACTVSLERGTAQVKVEGHVGKPVRVIGIDPRKPEFFADPSLHARLAEADRQDAGLVDIRSKSFYGFAGMLEQLQEQSIELNGQNLPIAAQFELGTDFGNDGTLLVSERLHSQYFPWRNPGGQPDDIVDICLLRTAVQGAELKELAKEMEKALGPISVTPTLTLIAKEKDFWERQTPVGKIFMIGTVMGLIVGALICYQIQFNDITDHMPEFATLKAMGYSPAYFWSVILCQSFYLACLGFVPGVLASIGLYWVLSETSGLIMEMTLWRALGVWGLTIAMCVVSGAFAIRKLFSADPASLF